MKFAHMADCHIGSWRDAKLHDASTRAFCKAIDSCIGASVDFVLIAGDLFNTSFPRLENLKTVVGKLKELSDRHIPVYIVPGSHDYSPSGKTILDVLEEAGLFINVFKGEVVGGKLKLHFTIDKKTGAKITGMLGKRGALETEYYQHLITEHLQKEDGYKIFLFHSALDELKIADTQSFMSQPLSLLPKNFNYYAGGHVHIVKHTAIDGYGVVAYPGPLFPNSFSELEKLGRGGFYIVHDTKIIWQPILIYNVHTIAIDCANQTPQHISDTILENIKNKEFNNTLVLIRLFGIMDGKPSDIAFRDIFIKIYEQGAYLVMRNTSQLSAKDFEEIKIEARSHTDVEAALIKEHVGQHKLGALQPAQETELIQQLMKTLTAERDESERVADFEARVREELKKILKIEW